MPVPNSTESVRSWSDAFRTLIFARTQDEALHARGLRCWLVADQKRVRFRREQLRCCKDMGNFQPTKLSRGAGIWSRVDFSGISSCGRDAVLSATNCRAVWCASLSVFAVFHVRWRETLRTGRKCSLFLSILFLFNRAVYPWHACQSLHRVKVVKTSILTFRFPSNCWLQIQIR